MFCEMRRESNDSKVWRNSSAFINNAVIISVTMNLMSTLSLFFFGKMIQLDKFKFLEYSNKLYKNTEVLRTTTRSPRVL